ncbi:MAG: four helix bundle protein [Deltaproteobacteria bacterium]|nr:MAG: four helix bundle protein [Deltaproteobacteria bacterium]
MKITRFEELECWQRGRELTKLVYSATRNEAFKKDLRLAGQIQASATSTMANCAEGFIRRSNKEFIQFLFIAMSSAAEVQSHLYVALEQGYVSQEKFNVIYKQADKTSRLISGLINYLRTNERRYQQEKRQKLKKPEKL